jgi:N-acetylglucosaminyldiphosphoundecaprenol N-acetyl-beta-D-mannosaminyltransferase
VSRSGPGPAANHASTIDLLGTGITPTTYAELLTALELPVAGRARVVAFCNVHSVMTARRDLALAAALAGADVAAPDGMPLVWLLRRLGVPGATRVYGPDLMAKALAHGVAHGWRHYLFGATAETLTRLEARAGELAPGVRIVGRAAPPFRPLTAAEQAAVITSIQASAADFVWVGLGMPKQERWMAAVRDALPGTTLLGVGAAFDLLSGTVPQAPDWLQDRGLEWAYRLWREPRRLWRRYLRTNPAFVALVLRELAAGRLRAGLGRGHAPS